MNIYKIKDKETGKVYTIRKKEDQPKQQEQKTTPFNSSLKERTIGMAVGGPALSFSGASKAEEALPLAGSVVGGFLGSRVGRPNVGVGVGTTVGKLAEDSIQKLFRGGDDIDVRDAVILGGLASGGSKVFEVGLKSLGVAGKIIPEKSRAKLFDKALQAVNIGRKALSRNYGRAVDALSKQNPNIRVDLTPVVEKMSAQFNQIDDTLVPQLKTAVRNNKLLKDLIKESNESKIGFNVKNFTDMTLEQALEVKNAIKSATNSITRKAMKGKNTPNERIVFEILDDIDSSILSKFPKMSEIKKAYAEGRKAFDLARPLVEEGTAVESSIFSQPRGLFGMGGTKFMKSTQGKLATEKIMGMTEPGEKLFQALKLAHGLNRVADYVGRMGQVVFSGSVASKLLGSQQGGTD